MENKPINLYDDFGEEIGTYNPNTEGSLQNLYVEIKKAKEENRITQGYFIAYQKLCETHGLELSAEERITQKETLDNMFSDLVSGKVEGSERFFNDIKNG
jgi:hypothetical protein